MKFAIIGIGKTGQAMACYLMNKGQEVVLWDRLEEKVQQVKERGVQISGVISGHFHPEAEADLGKAVSEANYILIMTTSAGHLPVARLLAGKLPENSRVVILNGNWGALEFYSVLAEECKAKNVLLGETGGMPILSASNEVGVCAMSKIKNQITLASIPAAGISVMMEELKEIWPFLVAAENVVETSINNMNPILHAPITLFNITRLENGEDYSYYGDAATSMVMKYMGKADAERMAVAAAAGVKVESALDIMNSFWDDKYDSMYDALKLNKMYVANRGPTSLSYRFITEDVPYGVVPLLHLSRWLQVPAPYMETMISAYSLLMDYDFMANGPVLTKELLEAVRR